MLSRNAATENLRRTAARKDLSRRRAFTVAAFVALWMCAVAARLVYLQTAQHEWLSAKARERQQRQLPVAAHRGVIYDRAGNQLAHSVDTESLFAVPHDIEDASATVNQLARVLGLNDDERAALLQRINEAKERRRKFIWIARKIDDPAATRAHALNLKGVYPFTESKRVYPNDELAAHILGFVGLDDEGLAGVEQVYNAAFTGEKGTFFTETDAKRRAYDSHLVEPRDGQSLVLTIDSNIQYQVERALGDVVKDSHAKAGAAVVLDPHTGEILALANAPTFNPNEAAKLAPEQRRNQALQNIYEPGSTFKIVTYSAALEERKARADETIACEGAITFGGRTVHDHARGSLSLTEALAKSSNVAAIKLGMRVGNERLYEYIRRFGYGERTGVELPGETAGLLRPVARWQPTSIMSVAIGQEVGVTPVQVAAAFGALANDGVRVSPHLVREVRTPDGSQTLKRAQPETRRVVSAETARQMRHMLESVTVDGTAKKAQLDGYTAGGKTGTAQKVDPKTRAYSQTKYVASFAGFAPLENPAVVIVVVLDEPQGAHQGGSVAAPVFKQIAEFVLPYLNIAPDGELKSATLPNAFARANDKRTKDDSSAARESGTAENLTKDETSTDADEIDLDEDARRITSDGAEVIYAKATRERALRMPDLRGRSVRDAALLCARLGLELEARGEGRARNQIPGAGASVEAGQTVRVEFGR